jgi:hypothetical protein
MGKHVSRAFLRGLLLMAALCVLVGAYEVHYRSEIMTARKRCEQLRPGMLEGEVRVIMGEYVVGRRDFERDGERRIVLSFTGSSQASLPPHAEFDAATGRLIGAACVDSG